MPRSGTEVAGAELIGGTDLGSGHDRRMEAAATGGPSPGRRRGEGGESTCGTVGVSRPNSWTP